jgi:hypothetical protein
MLVTCGLRNAGPACEVEGEHFGLHGRYTSIAAQNISIQEYWKEDVFYTEISGLVREANTFGENLALYRTISVNNRENKIYLKDRLVNEGFKTEGIMLLYHLNWGYPLLSENTKLVLDAAKSELRDEMPGEEGNWNHFTPPVPNFEEIVYFHDLKEDTEGKTGYQLENPEINTRVKVSWHKKDLPFLTEWKMTGEGEYVLGLEPGNCQPIGRKQAIENKSLEMLDRLNEKEVSIEIDVENIKAKE